MSKRIFIGKHSSPQTGERMLMRISPPGIDADNLAEPAVFSSDNDFLRVHVRSPAAGANMTNHGAIGAEGRYRYSYHTTFPDLGYQPFIFYTICIDSESSLNNRVIFPWDANGQTDRYPFSMQAAVTSNAIWIGGTGQKFSQTLKVKFIVFKNRLR
ncbi:hypothetical protein D8666_22630 [Ochrobactrum soli]|uniref:hypothetical protein n=1 Tax=Ochrobactrum soli TaxID=2448455 RepID=UPI000EF19F87|nr:hypothetical protein [[Ochrobactrum] soli]RLL64606.1 hypothetical protein D8666_22630 [[Ochrobactrum] soli]